MMRSSHPLRVFFGDIFIEQFVSFGCVKVLSNTAALNCIQNTEISH